jgi:Tfp pilus assembly protein PilN
MQAINLLPEQPSQGSALSQVSAKTAAIAGACVLGVTCLFMGVSYFQAHSSVTSREDELAAIAQKHAKVQSIIAKVAANQGSAQARIAAFRDAASARIPWDNLLDDVSRILPSGAWLTSLNMSIGSAAPLPPGSTAAPPPVPTEFTVTGFAFSQNEVAKVMQRLELVPALQGVTLQNSNRSDVDETKAFQYTISASVLSPEVDR